MPPAGCRRYKKTKSRSLGRCGDLVMTAVGDGVQKRMPEGCRRYKVWKMGATEFEQTALGNPVDDGGLIFSEGSPTLRCPPATNAAQNLRGPRPTKPKKSHPRQVHIFYCERQASKDQTVSILPHVYGTPSRCCRLRKMRRSKMIACNERCSGLPSRSWVLLPMWFCRFGGRWRQPFLLAL